MYTSFHIENFRLFDTLDIEHLARVNLITGRNNSGKTSLLEAVFVNVGLYNADVINRISAMRGMPQFEFSLRGISLRPWDMAFRDLKSENEVVIQARLAGGETRDQHFRVITDTDEVRRIAGFTKPGNGASELTTTADAVEVLELIWQEGKQSGTHHVLVSRQGLQVEVAQISPNPAYFFRTHPFPVDQMSKYFTPLVRDGEKSLMIDALKIIEPRLVDLELLDYGGQVMLWGNQGGKILPLIFMGGGMNILAGIILSMKYATNGVVLLDEMESAFHYSTHHAIWKAIDRASRAFNTQVFITTHSDEFMVAAHEAFKETYPERADYDQQFRIYRLQPTSSGSIKVVTYDQEMVDIAIESGLEMR